MEKIVLAGGSGFLGGELARHFTALGWQVVILTRSPKPRTDVVREVAWDSKSLGDWARELEAATAVVNLTGRSVDCRYNAKNRREIMDSRVNSTRVVGEAIAQCKKPPRVWLNSSTATVYQHTFGKPHDESSHDMDSATDAKDAFSVEVAQAWERTLNEARTPNTRKIALRTSMVLGLGRNSVFPVLRRLTRLVSVDAKAAVSNLSRGSTSKIFGAPSNGSSRMKNLPAQSINARRIRCRTRK